MVRTIGFNYINVMVINAIINLSCLPADCTPSFNFITTHAIEFITTINLANWITS